MTRRLVLAAGFAAFALLATLNSAGYRYGAADQAFYIPAILRHLDPALFPRDAALIDSQSRLFVLDEILAALTSSTGLDLSWLFLTRLRGLVGRALCGPDRARPLHLREHWTIAALVVAVDAAASHREDGREYARRLFPSAPARVRGRPARHRRSPPPACSVSRSRGRFVGPACIRRRAFWFAVWVGVALVVNEPALRGR